MAIFRSKFSASNTNTERLIEPATIFSVNE